jgi:hypothetical protein
LKKLPNAPAKLAACQLYGAGARQAEEVTIGISGWGWRSRGAKSPSAVAPIDGDPLPW